MASPGSGGFDLRNALKVRWGTCLNLFSSEMKTVETGERKWQVEGSLGRATELAACYAIFLSIACPFCLASEEDIVYS